MKKKSLIKAVVILLIIGAALQAPFAKFQSEPWPALMLPRFGGVPQEPPYTYTALEIVARTKSGEDIIIARDDLLEPLPVSLLNVALKRQFRPGKPVVSPETRQWLVSKLSELYPGKQFEKVEFRWSSTSRFGPDGGLEPSTDTYFVDLR